MPTMEYSASVPDQVTNAIQELTNACSNWPQVPMPDMPVAAKLDDATSAAMNICHTALGTSPTMTVLTFGIFAGIVLAFVVWVVYHFLRDIYYAVKHFWFAIKEQS